MERAEAKRQRRPRWQIAYDRATAMCAYLRASETLWHADGDESLAYSCEATMNQKLAGALDHRSAYGAPLSMKTLHAVVASALLDGIYIGDLP
jgi:hypothetical protein